MYGFSSRSGPGGGSVTCGVRPAPGGRDSRSIRSRESASRNCTITCSRPSAPVRAASDRMTGPSSTSGASTVGHTYSLIRFQSSRASLRSADRAERRLSRQASRMRSSCGRPVIRPASSRTMVSSRTSARATSRWSSGTSRPRMRNR